MSTVEPRCPRCGAPLHATVAGALCPACLLGSTLAFDESDEDDLLVDSDPPFRTITILSRREGRATYLAEPFGTTRRVALTVCANRTDVRNILARFGTWRRLVSLQRYPGMARVVDVGAISESSVYFASEYVSGLSLDAALKQQRLDAKARDTVARQLVTMVSALHAAGAAHMRIASEQVRVSVGDSVRASLIGLGTALVLDGVMPDPQVDLADLDTLLDLLLATSPALGRPG